MSRSVRIPATLLLLLAACAAGACKSSFDVHREVLRGQVAQGRWEQAAETLDSAASRDLYGARNELLWLFDRGTVAQAMGDHETAIDTLNRAEDIMDRKRGEDVGDVLGALLINDTLRRYTGDPYEDIYVNVIKMLAHLEAGVIDGGATVEARRIASKANMLRDRYLEIYPAARKKAQSEIGDARRGDSFSESAGFTPSWEVDPPASVAGTIAENEAGQFIESTLGLYLTAAVWMHAGEEGNQRVAAERLVQTIDLHRALMRGVDPADFADLAAREADENNVLVVALSGLGPTKTRFRFPPIIIDGAPIYFELPIVRPGPSAASRARVIVGFDDASPLALVEDLGQVAAENHRRQLPLTYLRTFVRAAVKALATREAVRAIEKKNDDDLVRLGVYVGALLVPGLTERADVRAWESLPAKAHVGMLSLPPGEHRVRIEWLNDAGFVVDESRVFTVEVGDRDGLRAVVARSPR
ncbi:MAG: hypothetical protein ACTS27_00615 [Phycisphaerales bacterium]